jgi:hypothetical protein
MYNHTYKIKTAYHCIYGHFTATNGHQFSTPIHFLKLSLLRKESVYGPAAAELLRKKIRHVGSADQAHTYFLPVKLSSLRGARSTLEHFSP